MVEFVFAFPFFVLLMLLILDIALLSVRRLTLESAAQALVRKLSFSSAEPERRDALARQWLKKRFPGRKVEFSVGLRSLPTEASSSPFRLKKTVHVVSLILRQRCSPVFLLLGRWRSTEPWTINGYSQHVRLSEKGP